MAKKTIIPDFTLALGADLREAAAKMREMSRPPVHAPAQTPPPTETAAPAAPPETPSRNADASVPPQALETSGGFVASTAPKTGTDWVTDTSQLEDNAETASEQPVQSADIQAFSTVQDRNGKQGESGSESLSDPASAVSAQTSSLPAPRTETFSAHDVSLRQQEMESPSAAPWETESAPDTSSSLPEEASASAVRRASAPSAPCEAREAQNTALSPASSGGDGTPNMADADTYGAGNAARPAADETPDAAASMPSPANEEHEPSAAPGKATSPISHSGQDTPPLASPLARPFSAADTASVANHAPSPVEKRPYAPLAENAETCASFPAPERRRPDCPEESPSARPDAPFPPPAPSAKADGLCAPTEQPYGPVTALSAQEGVMQASSARPADPTEGAEPISKPAPQTTSFTAQADILPGSADGHQQSSAVIDSHKPSVTVNDGLNTKNTPQHPTFESTDIDSHQQSPSVIDNMPTVTDRHLQPSLATPSSVQGKPSHERLTDVSVSSFPEESRPEYARLDDLAAPTRHTADFASEPTYAASGALHPGRTGRPARTVSVEAPQERERRMASPTEVTPAPHKQSSTVTMTVNDTSNNLLQQAYPNRASFGEAAIASATLQEAPLGGARQTLLSTLERLRGQSPQVVVNLKRLAAAIGLSYGTVRNTISRLVREGVICTTQVRTSEAHGVCIEFLDDTPLQSVAVMPHQAFMQPTVQAAPRSTVINSHQQSRPSFEDMPPAQAMTPAMTDDDTSIWNADAELIADLWPSAAEAGFGPGHLAHLRRAYHMQGWNADNVSRCLRYLDWELDAGRGNGPAHVEQWMRIMRRQGHYPRPEGYVEPEVLRLQQQAQEQRELAQAQQELADAQALLHPTARQH